MAVPITIKVYKGDQLVATKDYDRDIIKIGRLSSAHLCLEDEKVSRIHSVIEVGANGALSIVDMGSVEGTFVNGKRVNKGAISAGDEIRVGHTILRLQPRAPAEADLASVATPEVAQEMASNPSSDQPPAQVVSTLSDAAQAPIPGERQPESHKPPQLPEAAPVPSGAPRLDRTQKPQARLSKSPAPLA